MESKLDIVPILSEFLIIFLCKFPTTLDEKCYKISLDLLHTSQTHEDKKIVRLVYCIHANFPTFFETSR